VDESVYAALAAGAAGVPAQGHPATGDRRGRARGRRRHGHPLPAVTATLIDSSVERKTAPQRAAALQRVATLSDREQEVLRLLTELYLTNRTQAAISPTRPALLEG
jgi:DNA-binding NarL/FixJ family response regulator